MFNMHSYSDFPLKIGGNVAEWNEKFELSREKKQRSDERLEKKKEARLRMSHGGAVRGADLSSSIQQASRT